MHSLLISCDHSYKPMYILLRHSQNCEESVRRPWPASSRFLKSQQPDGDRALGQSLACGHGRLSSCYLRIGWRTLTQFGHLKFMRQVLPERSDFAIQCFGKGPTDYCVV